MNGKQSALYVSEIEIIKQQLQDRNLKAVALAAGVSSGALYKLMDGSTSNPSYDLISKLKVYLNVDQSKK